MLNKILLEYFCKVYKVYCGKAAYKNINTKWETIPSFWYLLGSSSSKLKCMLLEAKIALHYVTKISSDATSTSHARNSWATRYLSKSQHDKVKITREEWMMMFSFSLFIKNLVHQRSLVAAAALASSAGGLHRVKFPGSQQNLGTPRIQAKIMHRRQSVFSASNGG